MSRFAKGGYVPSSDDPADDSIPIMLERGYVLGHNIAEEFFGREVMERLLGWDAPKAPPSESNGESNGV